MIEFLSTLCACVSGDGDEDESEIKLPPVIDDLTSQQEDMLNEAKKYCLEQSVAHVG